jgi:exopolysaccharide production protein ExoQ
MRRIAWALLLVFAFAIPWEYSLDLGEPFGNVARIAGILLLLAAVPAIVLSGRLHAPGLFQWLTFAFFLWFCISYFWTVDPAGTLIRLRAYFQEMMIVWFVWEFADTPADLRNLLRATVAGSWVLAILTLAAFRSPESIAAGLVRIAAYGQDPNDLARYLDLGFPLAALLLETERYWLLRLLAAGFIPVGLAAVLLTASREGFVAAVIALVGSTILLARGHYGRIAAGIVALPVMAGALWLAVPAGIATRLATIPRELEAGDLNQRINIWSAGWRAFSSNPFFGSGAGSFVVAARLAPGNTAHNTALSLVVGGGLCALGIALMLAALAVRAAFQTSGPLRTALVTALFVWTVTTFVATVEENRFTWLLLSLCVLAGRLAAEDPFTLATQFSSAPRIRLAPIPPLAAQPDC